MNNAACFKCVSCGKVYPLEAERLTCSEHSKYYSYLAVEYDYEKINGFGEAKRSNWEKYLPLLPVSGLKINFNEQKTPLIQAKNLGLKLGLNNLWIKDEGKNPTGSFKDKESIIAVNAANEFGIKNLAVVSSGNAAVSTAAYAQKAGLSCTCIVSKKLSIGKRFLLSLYGGKIQYQDGTYEDLYRSLIDQNHIGWNVTPGYNPYKEEGIKIIGFEIWEEIGIPDIIIVPCGNGTLLYGLFKAFWELRKIGLTFSIPKFVGVQIENGAPLAKAFKTGKEYEILASAPDSIAEGIIATESYSSPKALLAINLSGGEIIEVTDQEVKESINNIIRLESLVPEPTSATVYAGLLKLTGCVNKKIVAVQTASGMKNLKEIMESYLN